MGKEVNARRKDNTQSEVSVNGMILDQLGELSDDVKLLTREVVEIKTQMGFAVSKATMIEEVGKAVDGHFKSCSQQKKTRNSSPPKSEGRPVDWVQLAKIGGYVLGILLSMLTGHQIANGQQPPAPTYIMDQGLEESANNDTDNDPAKMAGLEELDAQNQRRQQCCE
jgi:hypothetical protein